MGKSEGKWKEALGDQRERGAGSTVWATSLLLVVPAQIRTQKWALDPLARHQGL